MLFERGDPHLNLRRRPPALEIADLDGPHKDTHEVGRIAVIPSLAHHRMLFSELATG